MRMAGGSDLDLHGPRYRGYVRHHATSRLPSYRVRRLWRWSQIGGGVADRREADDQVLGRQDEARNYGDLAAAVREAFARAYVTPSGRMVGDAPTAYAMALVWDLLPTAEQRAGAGARLADLVRANGFRIATG